MFSVVYICRTATHIQTWQTQRAEHKSQSSLYGDINNVNINTTEVQTEI